MATINHQWTGAYTCLHPDGHTDLCAQPIPKCNPDATFRGNQLIVLLNLTFLCVSLAWGTPCQNIMKRHDFSHWNGHKLGAYLPSLPALSQRFSRSGSLKGSLPNPLSWVDWSLSAQRNQSKISVLEGLLVAILKKHVLANGLVTVSQIHIRLVWGGVGWGGIIMSVAFPHELEATLHDLHLHFHDLHLHFILRYLNFYVKFSWSSCWCYVSVDATQLTSQSNHPWKFAIEKGPGAQSSNMEMHALFPVAVGVHREKPVGSHRWRVEENVRKSCGCPFWGWSDGRVVIPKVDGAFFW